VLSLFQYYIASEFVSAYAHAVRRNSQAVQSFAKHMFKLWQLKWKERI